ncbi:MAG: Uroporphyrinogen synthase [Ferruginibacter sp.]|nr:Uroporphyrinogen synthase [Ferruginibacter sp.]
MENNFIHTLCSRPVSESIVADARAKGVLIDCLSFISTEPIENVEVQQEIEHALLLDTTVVFTSMNAVEAVAEHLFDEQPAWRIYCIGQTTKQLVEKYFGAAAVAGTADDATTLAELIITEEDIDSVVFFCGDQRRDELPGLLVQNNIEVEEIIVYQTMAVPHQISKKYQGILFFSPSAVHSFFSVNKAPSETIFFAIGKTTAAAIKSFSDNRVLVAAEPGKEKLVALMLDFFTGSN